MIGATITINISRRPSDVFSYISNFANNPKWQGGMVEAYFTTEPPTRVGSEYTQVARFLGRHIESTFKVIEYEPGRLIKATTVASTFPITFTRIVEPEKSGSRVTAIVEGDASGVYKLAEPLMTKKVRASVTKDYQRLKKILEG